MKTPWTRWALAGLRVLMMGLILSSLPLMAGVSAQGGDGPQVKMQASERVEPTQGAEALTLEGPALESPMEAAEGEATEPPVKTNPPGTPDPLTVHKAAIRLDLPPAALQLGVVGLGHVYAREYGKARAAFESINETFPQSNIGYYGLTLLYQSWMLENFDYSQEAPWMAATERGMAITDAAIDRGDALAWNYFVRGSFLGMESVYEMRKGEYLSSVNTGLKSIRAIEKSMALDPEFKDPWICMGIYNFWRSVLSQEFWFLPFVEDKRSLGIRQMEAARDEGIFTGPGARLALSYSYMQNRRVKKALAQSEALADLYPDNLINNLLLGRMSLRTGKLRVARTYFHRVQRVDPENWLVDYYLGLLAMRERRYPQGRDHFKSYLSHQGDVGGQAWAHYRLGDCYWYLHEDALAQKAWRESAKMNSSLKGPQRRLAGKTPRRASSADAYSRPPTGGSKGKSGKAKSPSAQGGGAAAAKARYEARKAAEAAAAGGVPVPDVTPGAAGEPLPAEDAAAKEAAEADGAAVPGH